MVYVRAVKVRMQIKTTMGTQCIRLEDDATKKQRFARDDECQTSCSETDFDFSRSPRVNINIDKLNVSVKLRHWRNIIEMLGVQKTE